MRKCWYKDKNLAIFFDRTPDVRIRYALPSMTEFEKKSIKKYPFMNSADLRVRLEDRKKKKEYCFSIPKGYMFDGASIPQVFWRIIGSNTDNRFLIGALIHDTLCENKEYVENDRYFADKVFERLLYVAGVPAFKRWLMFHSVDNWQKFCKWEKK
ncbi:MAG: DUF1353 domain-containing protein [Muribaculaceae bacterium]|nr:DUF1353 domain-containing protein [Muribaculaceae bacterium]